MREWISEVMQEAGLVLVLVFLDVCLVDVEEKGHEAILQALLPRELPKASLAAWISLARFIAGRE